MALAPPLLPAARGRFRWVALFEWWHLLSLDAPTVAVLWSWSLARAMNVRLPASSLLLLGVGTWLIYVADRILDGLHLDGLGLDGLHDKLGRLRERHLFYARRRKLFLAAALPAGLLLLWLVVFHMVAAAREADTALFALAILYFFFVHRRRPGAERWLPKELAVGVLFAAATAVPAWTRLGGHGGGLIGVTVLFAVLCWLNCAAIEKWEWRRLSAMEAHASTRWLQSHLRGIILAVVFAAALACVLSVHARLSMAMSLLDFACMLSAGLLLALDGMRLSTFHLRIAADLALLTPLLCVVALR